MNKLNPIPSADIILKNWLTSDRAIEIIEQNTGKRLTPAGISYICRQRWAGKGDAFKVGRVWYIRPGVPDSYYPTRSG